jgi:hypothetical protein
MYLCLDMSSYISGYIQCVNSLNKHFRNLNFYSNLNKGSDGSVS